MRSLHLLCFFSKLLCALSNHYLVFALVWTLLVMILAVRVPSHLAFLSLLLFASYHNMPSSANLFQESTLVLMHWLNVKIKISVSKILAVQGKGLDLWRYSTCRFQCMESTFLQLMTWLIWSLVYSCISFRWCWSVLAGKKPVQAIG